MGGGGGLQVFDNISGIFQLAFFFFHHLLLQSFHNFINIFHLNILFTSLIRPQQLFILVIPMTWVNYREWC